ncbi:glycosyltransferase family 4 protein [Saccharopolyspora indica]|uniref:glycosyltransferase family 4 protein n=1 Tax=Saccharopolyspora indica TaxID=1229659 RepID=UPI0022EB41E6|nr:glycosyltransferase family 4 protein [Saccharopolyspora indica]MDA3643109.1 glycosyltransferase family 4 protein [Saccharopolyspora indica]
MSRVLALTDAPDDVERFCRGRELMLFRIGQLLPEQHDFTAFEQQYQKLKSACDLSTIDLVIAEYIEALPLLYFMRRDGYHCPALMIPHTNPYPLNILFYFLLIAQHPHPGDLVICGSANAASAYRHITGIPAANICTFGIKNIYRPGDRDRARSNLGLPADRPILLYTGRFMNDKGLAPLLAGYHRLRAADPELLLVMSTTHLDTRYHNQLAAQLEHVVRFQRLDRAQTVDLYNAADVYVSGATSIFETYGKAPLEAMACGLPVVVPRFDGFPYYVNDTNGALVDVDHHPQPCFTPYDFAVMNVEDFTVKCRQVLDRGTPPQHHVPDWATYDHTMEVLTELVGELLQHPRRTGEAEPSRKIDTTAYPDPVRRLLDHYELTCTDDLVHRAGHLGLIDRRQPGDTGLLRALHDEIFHTMHAETSTATP